MSSTPFEQRNPYKGTPQRPCIRLRLRVLDGSFLELEVVADTGNPFGLIISSDNLEACKTLDATDVDTNFGLLRGGWLSVVTPLLGMVRCYASDEVVAATQMSHPDFAGLAGLPLLRMWEFGGNADWFWLRST